MKTYVEPDNADEEDAKEFDIVKRTSIS